MHNSTKHADYCTKQFVDALLFLLVSVTCLFFATNIVSMRQFDKIYAVVLERNDALHAEIQSLIKELDEKDRQIEEQNQVNDQLVFECVSLRDELAAKQSKNTTKEETDYASISELVSHVCKDYPSVDPALVLAVIETESSFNPNASNGTNLGLMQIAPRWHKARAERLSVSDWFDPASNIRLGVDYLSEIHNEVLKVRGLDDWSLVLMIYNMGYAKANDLYDSGVISNYARSIMSSRASYQNEL